MIFNMNILLLFFALPVATIILAIVVEKILRCPVLTAATFFAIFLIVAFAVFDAFFLVFVIAYTIIAFITAVIAEFFFNRCRRREKKHCNCREKDDEENDDERDEANNERRLSNEDIRRIANRVANILSNTNNNCCNNCCNNSCSCCNNDVATVNVRNPSGEQTTWCCRRR